MNAGATQAPQAPPALPALPAVAAVAAWRPLKALLGGGFGVPDDFEVADLTLDSRSVRPGAAFLACRGRTRHGLEFAPAAVAAGARAVLWEPAPGVSVPQFQAPVLVLAVPELSAQAGYIADRFFGAPSARLLVAGVTGTNGKTTCAWLLAAALSAGGRNCGYLGTLGAGLAGSLDAGSHTTPDAVTLQRQLAQLRDAGAVAVAMEVSSHALDQQRCAGVRFQVAAFTNLSRDHLDYHGDMAAYAQAKRSLFDWPTLSARVINVDDAFGAELATRLPSGEALIVTGRRVDPAQRVPGARFVRARHCEHRPDGLRLDLETSCGAATLRSPLLGDFNADNLLTVLGLLLASGSALQPACELLGACAAPPGRMQLAGGGPLPLAIVDYAHTPDALDKALRAARAHCAGRLVCLFGCGGDRDRGKRAEMARVAESLADEIYLTDDNPRSEDPRRIIADISAGLRAPARAHVQHDRATAIAAAIAAAAAGDVVLVAGKGHEDYQLVGAERRAFSDLAQVRAALAARGAA
ncbi:MAG: UDP-N-acetylmuramoyl-L-alanyl-D-glutamate--2,6-diaminopimelate ligase [Gammaproteobacteria bacterium]|nr:UDP-N-acetylmuramoyl-L-alanyl-D-glutamate--2,6-diaminopimelate ligase [Gammaproteobacteria bacterium]